MTSKHKMVMILQEEKPYLKENYGVKKIALFGSFAKRNHAKTSDIDMVVEFEKPIGLKFVDLAEYLEKRLGRKTDILTNDGIRSIRSRKIAKDIKRSLQYV